MSFYPLFYIKGSAFWYELDITLQSQNKELDTYLKVFKHFTDDNAQISETFKREMINIISISEWNRIEKTYL